MRSDNSDPIAESVRLYADGRWRFPDTNDPLDFGPLGYFAIRTLSRYVANENIDTFLDIGGGEGTFGRLVCRNAEQVIIDAVVDSCRVAVLRGNLAIVGDGRVLPFGDTSFDMVLLSDILEHIPERDVPIMLNEARRVVRKNGVVLVHTSALGFYLRGYLRLGKKGSVLDADDIVDGHLNRLTKKQLWKYIEDSGFVIEKHVFYKHIFQPLSDIPIRIIKRIRGQSSGDENETAKVSVSDNKIFRVLNRIRCAIPFLDSALMGRFAGGAVIIKLRKTDNGE